MTYRKIINGIVTFFTMIAVLFAAPLHCLANELPIIDSSTALSCKLSNYNDICHLLALIENGDLERRLNEDQKDKVEDFLIGLAIRGSNPKDL